MTEKQRNDSQASTNGESRMQFSYRKGVNAWFDVDGIIISVWISSWSGRAIVRVEDQCGERIVSDKRTFRLSEQHEFSVGKTTYRVDIKNIFRKNGFELAILLYREETLIDSDVYIIKYIETRFDPETGKLNWLATIKAEFIDDFNWIPVAVGAVIGAAVALFNLI